MFSRYWYCYKKPRFLIYHKVYRLTDNIVVLRFSHRWCKITYVFIHPFYLQSLLEQELGYHKQIARKLRAQYVEGIYDNPVTLKCRLRVTQGHWKRNHWVDHTLLTISRVIWRWILSWPWNVGQRSLKVIENGTIWKLWYDFLFAFHSNYDSIFSHFELFSVN